MIHTYNISNITCGGCISKVKSQLLMHPDVLSAEVQIDSPQATVTMQKHLSVDELQHAIGMDSKYRISEDTADISHHKMQPAETKSWLATYKPLLIIAAFIIGVAIIEAKGSLFLGMNYFMAGFFLVFSFFKMLDIKGFATSYAMYDILAKRVNGYGYLYPFMELALGIAYLTGFNPVITNSATIVVMGFSTIGVLQSVMKKQQIQCACLGAVFNLPMSTLTIIEDLLMVAMAATALIYHA
jgi:cation transport ATPase